MRTSGQIAISGAIAMGAAGIVALAGEWTHHDLYQYASPAILICGLAVWLGAVIAAARNSD